MRILVALSAVVVASAFQAHQQQLLQFTRTNTGPLSASFYNPSDYANTFDPFSSSTTTTATAAVQSSSLSSSLSSSSLDSSSLHLSLDRLLLKPAHEHTNPLFGPPDKYLKAGHSIAPNLKAFQDDGSIITTTPMDQLPTIAQEAVKQGYTIVDASHFTSAATAAAAAGSGSGSSGSILPGFYETKGILPHHVPDIPDETMITFGNQIIGAAKFMNVFEKLPYIAFAYVLIDFFLLRPNIDLYKEDIEDDPTDIFAETLAVTGTRLATFCIIGIVTVTLFG